MVKCANKAQDCDVNAVCDNTRGSYNCTPNLIGFTVGERSNEQLNVSPSIS